ncbi:MAG: hypothetical protein IT311_13430 [Anaerolineales bacterium]|nr:hypothetical protein [Anaerolineales bacterium]
MYLISLPTAGFIAFIGALLYAIGDVLLLASKVNIDEYPKLKPFAKLLSDAEKMAALSPNRMIWGALLGVFGTPLVMIGYWQIYQGLSGANAWAALTTIGLFGCASVIGAFVHGTFYYLGEYVQALNQVDEKSQAVIAKMIERHKKVLIISYAPVMVFILIASLLFSALVYSGKTLFPTWIAFINPGTMTFAWKLIKKILPNFVRDATEGAGFNIAYMAFFACTTLALWK